MTTPRTTSVDVEVIPASPEHEPILANLLELYAHDLSEFFDLKLGADGRFGYERLPLYWKEPGRRPFLVAVNDRWAGFAFVRKGSQVSGDDGVWDVAEFFIVRGHRRLGIGTKVAHDVWGRFPGRWEVRVVVGNQRAKEFWERAVGEFTGGAVRPTLFDKDGVGWHVFSFESEGVIKLSGDSE
jgi:predicted acetyltransferase